MKSERTVIIVVAAILLVLCSAAACAVGLAAGSALVLIPVRRERTFEEWPERITPDARQVPEMMGSAALVIEIYEDSPAEEAGIELAAHIKKPPA